MCGLKIQTLEKLRVIRDQQEKSGYTAWTSNIFENNRTEKKKKRGDDFLFFNHVKKSETIWTEEKSERCKIWGRLGFIDEKIWLAIYLQKKKKLNEKDKYHFWSFNKEIYCSLSFT